MDDTIYQKIKATIRPDDRIIMSRQEIRPLRFPIEQSFRYYHYNKPQGLWYAVGTEWLDWTESEMPDWKGDHFYKIEITDKVLRINTERKFIQLMNGYRHEYGYGMGIDWPKLAENYSGIEISPYRNDCNRYMWYSGWDVASGCLWKRDAVQNIVKIEI
jgi:hypothetical protein